MNVEKSYVEANSANLPKVDTWMLFNFLKNGRKFSDAEFEIDKENLAINKYRDDSVGYVSVLRNTYYCVVKASIAVDKSTGDSCTAVRVLIHETKNNIFKVECKNCIPADCIHGFALLLWLHRRTEESVEQIVYYHKKPGSIFNIMPKQDITEDHLLTPKSSSLPLATSNYSNIDNCSPETKLFLHGSGMFSQSLACSSQLSQTVYRTIQYSSKEILSQNSNDCKTENSVFTQPLSQTKEHTYSTQLSQTVYHATQHTSENTSPKSSFDNKFSQTFNSIMTTREHCEAENSAFTKLPSQIIDPLTQITNTEISPKQSKTVRKSPYSQNKSTKAISPKTLKKQIVLSKKVSQLVKQPKIDNFFIKPKVDVEDSKPQIKHLFMGELVKNFLKLNKGTVKDFMSFAEKQMTDFLCEEAEKLTRVQRTDLWMDLRYGRITASIIHEAAYCHTINGSLVNKILGKVGRYQSPAMKRGIDLENKILHEVQLQENITTSSSGLFLLPWCPIVGASPDAIGSDFIVEIKAPISDTTFQNFLPNGVISKKCKNQMYLQMYCTGMKRGVFCVADPNFERNKKVTTVWLDYDDEFTETLDKAKMFWITAIFPRLVNL